MLRKKEEWEKIYKTERTPWDAVSPEPYLVGLVERKVIYSTAAIDIGCGTGNETIFLASRGFLVTAFDISATAISRAQEKARRAGVVCDFQVADVLKFEPRQKYNFCLDRACFHFLDPQERPKYVANVTSWLNPGALFLLIVSSDQESFKGPYQFSRKEITESFSRDFDILSLELISLEIHKEKPKPYATLLKKK